MRIEETNICGQILPMEKNLRISACEIPVAPILRQLPSVYKYTNLQIHKYKCLPVGCQQLQCLQQLPWWRWRWSGQWRETSHSPAGSESLVSVDLSCCSWWKDGSRDLLRGRDSTFWDFEHLWNEDSCDCLVESGAVHVDGRPDGKDKSTNTRVNLRGGILQLFESIV